MDGGNQMDVPDCMVLLKATVLRIVRMLESREMRRSALARVEVSNLSNPQCVKKRAYKALR